MVFVIKILIHFRYIILAAEEMKANEKDDKKMGIKNI